MQPPRYVGLCEGFGGLTRGVQAVLGGHLVAYAEIKAAAAALLADRHPSVPNLGDLTVADWSAVEAEIITVGWPCQPHSAAGLRLGEEDPRAIWPAVLDVIRTVRPLLVVAENVARVVTNGELRRVVRSLAAIGYVGAWRCLPAGDASIGAPHKRDRLCLVAVDASRPDAAGIVAGWAADAAHAEGDGRLARWAGAAGELGGPDAAVGGGGDLLPTPSADPSRSRLRSPEVAEALRLLPTHRVSATRTSRFAATAQHSRSGPSLDQALEIARGELPREFDTWVELPASWQPDHVDVGSTIVEPGKLLPTPSASQYGTNQGGAAGRVGEVRESLDTMARRDRFAEQWGAYAPAIARWETETGRRAPAPTKPSSRAPYNAQLSPEFVEWMMGLPEGWVTAGAPGLGLDKRNRWTAPGERNAFLSLLGDGVVPQWATAQVIHLLPLALDAAAAATDGDFFDALTAGLTLASTRRELAAIVAGARLGWAAEHLAIASLRHHEPDLPLGPGWASRSETAA